MSYYRIVSFLNFWDYETITFHFLMTALQLIQLFTVYFFQLFSSSYLNLFHVFWKNLRLFDFSKIHASWKESTLFWLALLFSVWHFFQQKIKMSRETPLQNKNKKRILFPYFNLSSLVVFSMICRKYNTILKTDDLSCTLLHNSNYLWTHDG